MRSKVIAFAALPLLVALAALSTACLPGANTSRANFDGRGLASTGMYRNNTAQSGWIATEPVQLPGSAGAPFWNVNLQDQNFSTANWHGKTSAPIVVSGVAAGNNNDGGTITYHGGIYPGESFSTLFSSYQRGAPAGGVYMDYQMAIVDGGMNVIQAF